MNDLAHHFLGEHDFSAFGAIQWDDSEDNTQEILYQLFFLYTIVVSFWRQKAVTISTKW
jgi:tRNA U38,U39,U40 pseudouridine synthase TruA